MKKRPNPEKYGAYDDHRDEDSVDILIVRGWPEKVLHKHQKHTDSYQDRSHN